MLEMMDDRCIEQLEGSKQRAGFTLILGQGTQVQGSKALVIVKVWK